MSERGEGAAGQLLETERSRPELSDLDLLPTAELVALMCADIRRVPDAVAGAEAAICAAVDGIVARLGDGGRLVYVGAGTAGRIGMLDAAEAGPTFNVPAGQVVAVLAGGRGAFEVAVENAEDDRAGGAAAMAAHGVGANDVVVGIAASGTTPFVLGAIEAAAASGALTVALACNPDTALAGLAAIAIEVPVGAEIVAGSTRLNAGTAQKVVLNILSTAAMVRLGKTYGGLMVDLRVTNSKLRTRAARIVGEIAGVDQERARAALEAAAWNPKRAAVALVGGFDADEAGQVLARHQGRLRAALLEIGRPSPDRARGKVVPGVSRRCGVTAAFVAGRLVPGDVEVSGDRITAVGLAGSGSGLAVPLLVDAQVNGYGGIDVLGADVEALRVLGQALLRDGVGAYQPTLISSSEDELVAALGRLSEVHDAAPPGAAIIGVHLEGPFLSPGRAGTHPPAHLRPPDRGLLDRLLSAGPVTMVTLAPELPGAIELVELCVARGVVVSLGHSEATAAEAQAAFDAGAAAVTHLYNAMPPLSAREPGLAGLALARPGTSVQLIADGAHVSDPMLGLAFAIAAGRVSLVSDAMAAAGVGDGRYRLGSVEVTVADGVARRSDGTLAGSAARLADGLAKIARLGVSSEAALAAVSLQPGRLLRRPDLGCLELGGPADLAILDDELVLRSVLRRGQPIEARER